MKALLNWIMLLSLVLGALGGSPLAQDVSAIAPADVPLVSSESTEPLILPFTPAATVDNALQMVAEHPGTTEPPAPAPFTLQLETLCDARGQTARLSWSVTGELPQNLGEKSEVLIKLPKGLQPLGGMAVAPDGLLHLDANIEGQIVFSITPDATEFGWLEAELISGEAKKVPAQAKFIPGA